ncbi:MAG: hemerythrin domain-containing protein [Rikenellaceae bacterium]
MSDLICNNYSILQVMSRFDISLGVGDKSVDEVCRENGVDTATFLAIVNLLLHNNNRAYKVSLRGLVVEDLMKYLHNSHSYYLGFKLPSIRESLIKTLEKGDISSLLIRYFDEYVEKVKVHLRYEEDQVFPYVERLSEANKEGDFSIDLFCAIHDNIDEPLTEFRNLIIKYYTGSSSYEITTIICDLLDCASDLMIHNLVEDKLLVPLIKSMED